LNASGYFGGDFTLDTHGFISLSVIPDLIRNPARHQPQKMARKRDLIGLDAGSSPA